MTQQTTGLTDLFTLDRTEHRAWVGHSDGMRLPQLFGGQLVGQTIMAAGASVDPDKSVHSIHTSFLRGGRSGEPVTFRVEDLRDGRSISTREVAAWQGDRLLCRSIVSCTVEMDGITHSRPYPVVAPPEDSVDIRDAAERDGGLGEYWEDFASVDVRLAPPTGSAGGIHSAAPPHGVWMRSADRLPEDQLVHRAALAYASDLMLMSAAVAPHGHVPGEERSLARDWSAVSLDHAMWFHGHAVADEWMLFEHASPMARHGRALIEAAVFDDSRTQICHVAQEALIRDQQ